MLDTTDTIKSVTNLSDIRRRILLRIPKTKFIIDQQREYHKSMRTSEQNLEDKIARIYQSLIDPAMILNLEQLIEEQPVPEKNWWYWRDIFHGSTLNIGIMGLDPKKPVPMHDHPDKHVILLVLSGTVIVDQFDIKDPSKRHEHILQLRHLQSCEKHHGEVAMAFPDYANIHALHCESKPAVLLSLQLHNQLAGQSNREKSWYYPLFPQTEELKDIWVKKLLLH